ncbi:MAG: hypothetical protein ACMXYB_02770 [Candidatus Woesearchaeota archaeon]
MLSSKFKFLLIILVFLFSIDISFSCNTIYECFNQGNFNVSEWSGSIQFQFLSLIILLFLIIILLKEDLMNRFQLENKSAALTSWILIISLILAVSISQQNAEALRFVFLVAATPLALLAYVIASKVKGEENSWFSNLGLVSIGLGVYIFGRLIVIFFGSVDLLQVVPLISFIIGFTGANILDLVVIGAVFFFKHIHKKEMEEARNNRYSRTYSPDFPNYSNSQTTTSDSSSDWLRFGIRKKKNQLQGDTESKNLFPNKVTNSTNIVEVLKIDNIIKQQIVRTLKFIQEGDVNTIDKNTLKNYLRDILNNLKSLKNSVVNQQFKIIGTFHQQDDSIDVVISTFTNIVNQLSNSDINNQTLNEINHEIINMNRFFETIKPEFDDNMVAIYSIIDLGTVMYHKNKYDYFIQDMFKFLCDDTVRNSNPSNSQYERIISINTQIQGIVLKNSDREIIREFCNEILLSLDSSKK